MSKRMVDLKVEDGNVTSINGYEVGGGTAVEANPQEQATQQLEKIKIDNIAYNIAGGGGGNISVTNSEQKYYNSNNSSIAWLSRDGFNELKANTAYEVGDSVVLKYLASFPDAVLDNNQIIAPVGIIIDVAKSITTITYGGVVLVMTGFIADPTYNITNSNTYQISVSCNITYSVVKAGTTGAVVTPPSPPQTYLKYLKYTLGAQKTSV